MAAAILFKDVAYINLEMPGARGEIIVSITHSLVVERSYFSITAGFALRRKPCLRKVSGAEISFAAN